MKIDPDAAGLDEARLERITDHLERRYIEPKKIAGCQTLVARHGHVGYFRSHGSMELDGKRPVRDDTLWRIYSMTKPITSVALMTLFEEGHFQLGDPVTRFIPEFEGMKVMADPKEPERLVEAETEMTIRDLLMHMAGLAYSLDPSHPVDRAYVKARISGLGGQKDLAELVTAVAQHPLKYDPGTRWSYSIATDVCARVAEVISGQSYDVFLRERVLDPLGMKDTGFRVPESEVERLPTSYRRAPDKSLDPFDPYLTSTYLRERTLFSGGAGLVSTAEDYLRFCQMLLDGGELDGVRILGRRTVELMSQNHLPGGVDLRQVAMGRFAETGFDGIGFGLGFAVGLGDVRAKNVGSTGDFYWGGMASTAFWIDPTEDIIVIFLVQLMPSATFNFRGQLKSIVYGAITD